MLKFEGFKPAKKTPIGQWWEGARAYYLYRSGATKIVQWILLNGAIPADWALNSGILNVEFDLGGKVGFKKKNFSFTNQLK